MGWYQRENCISIRALRNRLRIGLLLTLPLCTLTLALFSACSTSRIQEDALLLQRAMAERAPHLVAHCHIIDWRGERLWGVPGTACIFFEDGSYLRSLRESLTMYHPNHTPRWTKKIHGHHQLNLSPDGERILVLSDSIHRVQGKNYRFDKLYVFDLAGKQIASFNFYSIHKWLGKNGYHDSQKRRTWRVKSTHLERYMPFREFTHANSFYEIPTNKLEDQFPALRSGNYIVNDNLSFLVFILDKNLKKVIWHARHDTLTGGRSALHDVHVLESGEIFFYANRSFTLDREPVGSGHSSIDLYHPVLKTRRSLFRGDSRFPFFSIFKGGMQLMSERLLLFSDTTRKDNQIHLHDIVGDRRLLSLSGDGLGDRQIQQVKAMDLSRFLEIQSKHGL